MVERLFDGKLPIKRLAEPEDQLEINTEGGIVFPDKNIEIDGYSSSISLYLCRRSLTREEAKGRSLFISENGIENIPTQEALESGYYFADILVDVENVFLDNPLEVDISMDGENTVATLLMENITDPETLDIISEFRGAVWKSPAFPSVPFQNLCIDYHPKRKATLYNISYKTRLV